MTTSNIALNAAEIVVAADAVVAEQAAVKITASAQKALNIAAVFSTASAQFAATKQHALAQVEQAESESDKSAFSATAKTAQTHERYAAALADMSEKALLMLSKYKVDAEQLALQSREMKKRSIAILEALASQQHVNDIALDAVLQFIVAKDAAKMTLEKVRHEMNHKTTTQAQYFKSCAVFFDFATYSKADKEIILKKDSKMLKDLLAIYTH